MRINNYLITILIAFLYFGFPSVRAQTKASHTFSIGDKDFLLDNQRFQIRCGEIHFARIPEEYWEHRLKLCKAMGLNTVCAYLFWNYHEFESGKFQWEGSRDVVKFCQLAQKEGLWVILRPGPYACAEWEMGGLPWWLLKNPDIKLRTRDTVFIDATRRWMKEVGKVLGSQQITKGGPILMVQVENEYGYFADDAQYMGIMRQSLIDAGFNVPLFACNPPLALKRGLRKDLFQVVNFGSNPEAGFKTLREVQPNGPAMCGEFYSGWFDTWGLPHHKGNIQGYLTDLEYMLKNNASFSIYMAHGGTSFDLWAGCDRPFKPDVSCYDYDAPISEAGWIGEKFQKTRELMAKYLLPGETLPEPPATNPVIEIPEFQLQEIAPLFDNLPRPKKDIIPQNMEAYNQGRGVIVYRTTLPAGEACILQAKEIRDFAWIYIDNKQMGIMDRRNRSFSVPIPKRSKKTTLDILVVPMGRVNFGIEVHDRKGIFSPVSITSDNKSSELKNWSIYNINLTPDMLAQVKWQKGKTSSPAFWHGQFTLNTTGDVFLNVSSWGKGVVWVNDHCLGRFWNIGPTQTMYLPGVWLKKGINNITVLDILGPQEPKLTGLKLPILNQLRPELDFIPRKSKGTFSQDSTEAVYKGSFTPEPRIQEVKFPKTFQGRQFCIESINSFNGSDQASISELDILDENGNSIPHTVWTIAFTDSEENASEDGSALNAINGQAVDYWITTLNGEQSKKHPHKLVIELGNDTKISGFRYTSRPGNKNAAGRIKDYRIYIGNGLVVNNKNTN
jgi:beta-galactosidase